MTEKIYEDDKELDVYEANRINKQYSDDTWELVGYTSELRNNNDNSFYAFVDFNADDVGTIRECPHCLTFEIHNKLGPKIKKKGEPEAPDDYLFGSCHECGNTFALYEATIEPEIKDSLETVGNPFEEHESIIMSVGKRKKKDRQRAHHSDPELDELLRIYGEENVKIHYGSNS